MNTRLITYNGNSDSKVSEIKQYIDIPKNSVIVILTTNPTEYNAMSNENKQDTESLKYAFVHVNEKNEIYNYGRQKNEKEHTKNPLQPGDAVNTPADYNETIELFDVSGVDNTTGHFHYRKLDTKELKNTADTRTFETELLDFLNKTKMNIRFEQSNQGFFANFRRKSGGGGNKTRKIPAKKMVHNRTIKNLVNYGIEKE